jgi:hypothetical protein
MERVRRGGGSLVGSSSDENLCIISLRSMFPERIKTYLFVPLLPQKINISSFCSNLFRKQKELFLFVQLSSWPKRICSKLIWKQIYTDGFVPFRSTFAGSKYKCSFPFLVHPGANRNIPSFKFCPGSEEKCSFSFQFLPGAKGFVPIRYRNESKNRILCVFVSISLTLLRVTAPQTLGSNTVHLKSKKSFFILNIFY